MTDLKKVVSYRSWTLGALTCAALLSACTNVRSTGDGKHHTWTEPGKLRIGMMLSPASLSPILATDTTEGMLARLVFDPLTEIDADGHTIPILASSVPTSANGGISHDGRTITFHLRHNIHWHDGALFTSADVAFTFDAIMNGNNNVATRYGFTEVDHVVTPDRYTIVFHLRRKFAPIVTTLFGSSDNPYEILPAHLLKKFDSLNNVAFNSAPIGTGPFVFDRWMRGDRIEYHANPTYFRGKPKLATIVAHIIPDENTDLNELRTHSIDWFFEPSPQTFPQIRSMQDIRYSFTQENAYSGMLINVQRGALRDVRVRHAIEAAIDKARILTRFTFDTATPADEDLPPFIWAYDAAAKAEPYNPTHAKALLRQAGFTQGPDGILTRDGSRLSLQLSYVQGQATNSLVSVAVQADLRNVGIDAQIHPYVGTLLFAPKGMGGILSNGRFDLNLSSWYSGFDPDNSSQFRCSARPPEGSNYTGYCNPEMEAAQTAALDTYNVKSRKAAYARIEQNLAKNVPQVFFYHPRPIQAFNSDFKGLRPSSITESWNAYQWAL